MMTWIGAGHPRKWGLKREVPREHAHLAVRVRFRFETAWILQDENRRVLFSNGMWADTFDFHLRTPGHVIGLRDLAAADAFPWGQEWRAAMADRIRERLALGRLR